MYRPRETRQDDSREGRLALGETPPQTQLARARARPHHKKKTGRPPAPPPPRSPPPPRAPTPPRHHPPPPPPQSSPLGGADASWHPPLPHACASRRAPPARSQNAGATPGDDAVTRRGRRPGRCWSAWPGAARGTRPWGRRPSRQGTWLRPRRRPVRSERSRPRP